MADNSANIYPYPFQFDPSQWSNKYSPYNGVAIPATQYAGTPRDAFGNPIASYQQALAAQQPAAMPASTSLNSSPQSYANPNQGLINAIYQGGGQSGGGFGGQGSGTSVGNGALLTQLLMGGGGGTPAQPTAAAAAPAASSGPNMSQAYLQALANPGHISTPGATVAQAPTPTGQSNVLQQFLQNWQNKGSPTTGAGNYNNAGFYNALQGNV